MKLRLLILGAVGLSAHFVRMRESRPGGRCLARCRPFRAKFQISTRLYGQNCAGCHGEDGKGGAAIALADPVYLAIADDAILRRATAGGIPGTSMPAFAQNVRRHAHR